MESSELVDRLLAGERRAFARLITRVEDGSREQLREVVRLLHPHTGSAQLVGITGPPGVGKSTLVSRLIAEWRSRGRTVAVLAVDPSSPFSGGALLGDRVRMQEHVLDEGVFVRSMASRGHLGGLSWATGQGLLVLDAAGYDLVVVETVGVGQAEVEIASIADTTVVVLAPGMGDAIQAAKAGILEVADLFCVNKADRDGVHRTVQELQEMQSFRGEPDQSFSGEPDQSFSGEPDQSFSGEPDQSFSGEPDQSFSGEPDQSFSGEPDQRPAAVHRTVASTGEGIAELVEGISEHYAWLLQSSRLAARRVERARFALREIVLEQVRARFALIGEGDLVDKLARQVADRELDPYSAADRLLAELEAT